MSCGKDAKACSQTASGHGQPAAEAAWAEGRAGGGHCDKCGGFLTREGVCHNPACGSDSLAMALATAPESVMVRDLWRGEFRPGLAITLQNGTTLSSGERYTGKEYTVEAGKKKRVATVGRTLTRAVDGVVRITGDLDGEWWDVEMADGVRAWYAPERGETACSQGCVGMCHHQMGALLAGEASMGRAGSPTGAQLEDTWLKPKFAGGKLNALATSDVIQANDAAYAHLTTTMTGHAIKTNATGLVPAWSEPAETEPKKPKEKPARRKKKKTVDTPKTGNKAVNKLMAGLGVASPLPTTAFRLAQGDKSYHGNPVPVSDPRYELDEETGRVMTSVMRRTNLSWRAAARRVEAQGGDPQNPADWSGSMEDRTWGLYGPPGTGKNSMGREIAASLGLGYMEVDVHQRTDFQALLADTVIEADGQGGTRTKARLGAVGRALVEGNVVAVNEIVAADPDAQTALHQVVQDGIIRAPGPEGASKYWKVHPNSMLFLTWNPNTTREDKPGAALLSRTPSYRLDYPKPADEARRLSTAMDDYFGEPVRKDTIKRSVNLARQLRELYEQGEIESPPTYRELQSFTKEVVLNEGDPVRAAELFRVLCSQGPDHEEQWKQIKNFASSFQAGSWQWS